MPSVVLKTRKLYRKVVSSLPGLHPAFARTAFGLCSRKPVFVHARIPRQESGCPVFCIFALVQEVPLWFFDPSSAGCGSGVSFRIVAAIPNNRAIPGTTGRARTRGSAEGDGLCRRPTDSSAFGRGRLPPARIDAGRDGLPGPARVGESEFTLVDCLGGIKVLNPRVMIFVAPQKGGTPGAFMHDGAVASLVFNS